MVRFHYGHPDVWDKVWAMSCGGVAKASKTLHVSEDIFGGFNVILRGGTIDYAEFVHCGKGMLRSAGTRTSPPPCPALIASAQPSSPLPRLARHLHRVSSALAPS